MLISHFLYRFSTHSITHHLLDALEKAVMGMKQAWKRQWLAVNIEPPKIYRITMKVFRCVEQFIQGLEHVFFIFMFRLVS